jgi:hypothetical protein
MTDAWHRIVPLFVEDSCTILKIQPWHACGILGNIGAESGKLKYTQEIHPLAGRGGLGWLQFTGPRRKLFEAWCQHNRLKPSDYKANLGFMCSELLGYVKGSDERFALSKLKATKTVRDAAIAFCQYYERPGIPHTESRIKLANEAWYIWKASIKAETMPSVTPDLEPKSVVQSRSVWTALVGTVGTLLTALGYAPISNDWKGVAAAAIAAATPLVVAYFQQTASRPVSGSPLYQKIEEQSVAAQVPTEGMDFAQPTSQVDFDNLDVNAIPIGTLLDMLTRLNEVVPQLVEQTARLSANVPRLPPP